MAILNIPTIDVGVTAAITLTKSELEAIISDPYYSDMANWKLVVFRYTPNLTAVYPVKHLIYDTSLALPSSDFLINTGDSDESYAVNALYIFGMDGSKLVIENAELITLVDPSEFLLDANAVPPFQWNTFYTEVASTGSGELHRTGSTPDWQAIATNSIPFSGDFNWSGTLKTVMALTENMMVGYKKSLSGIPDANPANELSTALYVDGGIPSIHRYTGIDNTSTSVTQISYMAGDYYFEIARTGSAITAKINGETIFTDSYSGDLYPIGIIAYNVGSQIVNGTTSPSVTVWGAIYGQVESFLDGNLFRDANTGNSWIHSGRSLLQLTGDFSFTGTWNTLGTNIEGIVGYTKYPVLATPSGTEFDSGLYTHANQTNLLTGAGNTAVSSSVKTLILGDNLFEISRVSGLITAKVDGQTIFTDAYAGNVYLGASIYTKEIFSIVSSTLI